MLRVVELLDRRGIAAHVGVVIGACGIGVGDTNALDYHLEGPLSVVGLTASPIYCALLLAGIAGGPHTKGDASWRLRIVLAGDSIFFVQGAHNLVVDEPGKGVRSPVPLIGDKVVLVVIGGTDSRAIPCRGVTLSEVIRLDRGGVMAQSFPIDLIKIVGH